jgi:CHAD domain-containing protein
LKTVAKSLSEGMPEGRGDSPPDPSPAQRDAANTEASRPGRTSPSGMSTSLDGSTTTGMYASACILKLTRRLNRLRAEVLADTTPEALHQLRVTLRRLRTVLTLFGPALQLPKGVSADRLAEVARRTSRTRDLDVLGLLLRSELVPVLPDPEQHQLARALRRLRQERDQAFATLVAALQGRRLFTVLARLDHWSQHPRATVLGALPLRPWASEWLGPIRAGLFLEEGWFCQDPREDSLHALRKRLKVVRYALDALQPLLDAELLAWLEILKAAQEHLGEIHDLQVLTQAFQGEGTGAWTRQPLPTLQAALKESEQRHWQRWVDLRNTHTTALRRQAFSEALTRLSDV